MSSSANKLSIGTAQFGMPYGISNKNGQVNANGIKSILDFAYENDINTLDTAKAYGNSEESIGNYLKQTEKTWHIITKVSDGDQSIIEQIHHSTKKLTLKPKVVLAHSANLFLDLKFQVEIQKAKDSDLIDSIGVSLYNDKDIAKVLDSELEPELVQLPMNILDTQLYRQGVLEKLFEKGIEIHVRSVFLQGLFYLSKNELEERFGDVIPILDQLRSIGAKAELTLAELSLLWLASLKEVSKIIIGVDHVNQLKTHIKTLKKNVDSSVFEEALILHYENENILNPSLWPSMS